MGFTDTRLDCAKDYILKLPNTIKDGTTMREGGLNIDIIGGHITLPVTADLSNGANSRGIYIKNNCGTVHIEGVLIDASGGGMSDGIDISSPNSIVQIVNVRIDSIYGFNDQFHANCIQPFGGLKDLRVDNFTCYTAYQGQSIWEEKNVTIGSAEIARANFVAIHDQIGGPHNNGGYIIWLVKIPNVKRFIPSYLKRFMQNLAMLNHAAIQFGLRQTTLCVSHLYAPMVKSQLSKVFRLSGMSLRDCRLKETFAKKSLGSNYVTPGYLR